MHNKHGRRNHRVVPPKTVEALSTNAILAAYEHQAGERRARAAFGGFIRSSDQGSLGYLVAPDVKDDSKSWQAGNVRSLGKSVRLATTLPFAICDRHLRPFENRSGVRNSFGAINSDSKPDAPPCKAATIQFFRAENRMTLFCVNHSQTANLAKILQSRLNAQSERADSTCFTSISNFPFASSSALPAVNNSLGTYR